MKNSYLIALALLFSLHSTSIFAVYTIIEKYVQNEGTDRSDQKHPNVFVFGDCALDPQKHDDSYYISDADQSKMLFSTLSQAASSKKSTAFILDCSLSEAKRAYDQVSKVADLFDSVQIGVGTQQALYALLHNNKFGSIDFICSDHSGEALLTLLRSIDVVEKALGIFQRTVNTENISLFKMITDQDEKKIKLIARYSSLIKEMLSSAISDITVKELKKELDEFVEKGYDCNCFEYLHHAICLKYAKEFIKDYADSTRLKDVIWHVFTHEPLISLQEAANNWIYPLHKIMVSQGLKAATDKALQNYSAVVISCVNNNTVVVRNFLRTKNYKIAHGYVSIETPINTLDFSEIVDSYLTDIESKFFVHTCQGCFISETRPDQFFSCEKCHNFWFCSEECAEKKEDYHKAHCTPS